MGTDRSSNLPEVADEIIKYLSEIEKVTLTKIGRIKVSKHKNIRENTIYKKVPNQFHDDLDDCINNLIKRGLIMRYRHKNYNVSPLGRIVAEKLYKMHEKNIYGNLKILIVNNII